MLTGAPAGLADPAAAAKALRGLYVVTGGFFLTFAGYAAIEVPPSLPCTSPLL